MATEEEEKGKKEMEKEEEEGEKEEGVVVRKSCHFLQLTPGAGCAKQISIVVL